MYRMSGEYHHFSSSLIDRRGSFGTPSVSASSSSSSSASYFSEQRKQAAGVLHHLLPSSASPASVSSDVSSAMKPCSRVLNNSAPAAEVILKLPLDEDDDYDGDSVIAECRICQEEEDVVNLEKPCACSGSIKYAHRKCVQRWCDEKGDTICEICQQAYKSGYTAPPSQPSDIAIDFSEDWASHTMEFHDARFLAMAAAQRRFLDAQYEEANSSSAACCRSAALILMALLLLRHAIAMATATAQSEEDASMFFTLFILRAIGFLLPCYIMARAMNMLQRRNQRQDVAMAAAEVALLLQAGQSQGFISLAPGQSHVAASLRTA